MSKLEPTPWEVRDSMIRLAANAREHGLHHLSIVYGVSALRLGSGILEERIARLEGIKSKPLPRSARGASDADPV